MKVTIQAVFPGGEEARLAASSLAAAQGGGLNLSISTHRPGEGISHRTPLISAIAPGMGATSGTAGGTMVTVVCDSTQEAFVMGELAALGARRVSQTSEA